MGYQQEAGLREQIAALTAERDQLKTQCEVAGRNAVHYADKTVELEADLTAANERAAQWQALAEKREQGALVFMAEFVVSAETLADGSVEYLFDRLRNRDGVLRELQAIHEYTPASALAAVVDPLHARIAELKGALLGLWEASCAPEDLYADGQQTTAPTAYAHDVAERALSSTPAQSLAAHDAEVRKWVLLEAAESLKVEPSIWRPWCAAPQKLRDMANEAGKVGHR